MPHLSHDFRLTDLADDDVAAVHAAATEARFAARETLIAPGSARHLLICREGYVKVVGDHGEHPVVLAVHGPGELLGEIAFLDDGDHTATVVALTDVVALQLTAAAFAVLLEERPHLHRVIVGTVTARLRSTSALRTEQLASPAILRVSSRILHLAAAFGSSVDGEVVVPVPLSRADVASWAGVSRDSGTRAVRQLVQAGWVEVEEAQLRVLDLAALERFVGSTTSSEHLI